MQQHPSSEVNVNQRIARISAHLDPPNIQMENAATVSRLNCRAKGGNAGYKVAILGAAGGIGQPLAMLMKMNPLISVLHLYDVVNTPGVTSDISHMDTGAVVRGFLGQQQLDEALTGMELVIIPAGVPRKPGMTRDDLFNINAGIVKTISEAIARQRFWDLILETSMFPLLGVMQGLQFCLFGLRHMLLLNLQMHAPEACEELLA